MIFPDSGREGAFEGAAAEAAAVGSVAKARWMRRSDGTEFRSEGALAAMREEDGGVSGFLLLLRDATASFEAAEALRAAKDEAERANRAKDRFLAVLSHELRAPLAPVATAARILEAEARLPESLAKLPAMIRRNVALQSRLIDDLFDVSAIAAGKAPLRVELVDLREVCRAVMEMVAEAAGVKGVELSKRWESSRAFVLGDPARLQQIVWNLLRNAVKFTPSGGRVELSARDEGTPSSSTSSTAALAASSTRPSRVDEQRLGRSHRGLRARPASGGSRHLWAPSPPATVTGARVSPAAAAHAAGRPRSSPGRRGRRAGAAGREPASPRAAPPADPRAAPSAASSRPAGGSTA